MATIGSSPYCWLEFSADGTPKTADVTALKAMLATPGLTDVVFISHGWRNDKTQAKGLYSELWANTEKALKRDPRHIAVCGILWPSKTFAEDFDVEAIVSADSQNALSNKVSAEGPRDLTQAELDAVITDFKQVFGSSKKVKDTIAAAQKIAASGLSSATSGDLVRKARKLVGDAPADTELSGDVALLREADDLQLLMAGLVKPPRNTVEAKAGKALDIGSFFSSAIQGAAAAAGRLLNMLTYYEMKNRAGVVGESFAKLLGTLPLGTLRVHFAGHSFGARLVSAAVNSAPASVKVETLTLLQGAFSHNAYREMFEGQPGAFPKVMTRVAGPISVTHTFNDKANTLAYAIASRLANDKTRAIGDANDKFGAMGANGPQGMTAGQFVPVVKTKTFAPARGKVNTFLGDDYIKGHNDIVNETCGKLFAATIDA